MEFGDKLIEERKNKGLSQEQLAEKLGVSRQAISRWEAGNALPDVNNLKKLSKLFEVSMDYLLNDNFVKEGDVKAVMHEGENKERKLRRISFFLTLSGVIGFSLLYVLSCLIPSVKTVPDLAGATYTIREVQSSINTGETNPASKVEGMLYVPKQVYSFFPFLSYYHLGVVAMSFVIMIIGGIVLRVYVKKKGK